MSFFQLVRREMQGSLGRLVFVSAMGGVSTTAIIGAINAGAQEPRTRARSASGRRRFSSSRCCLFIQTQHYILITTTAEIGAIIHKLRVRLMDLRAPLRTAAAGTHRPRRDRLRHHQDTAMLTQASNMLAFAVQGALLIMLVGDLCRLSVVRSRSC